MYEVFSPKHFQGDLMHKKIAIVQSNYIPWKGYFDLINMVDELVLYDHVQFTRQDWRNRNIIKTTNGPLWLTIPVEMKGRLDKRICDIQTNERNWNVRHWKTISHNYARSACFKEFRGVFEDFYNRATNPLLSRINYHFVEAICNLFGIKTKLSWSTDYHITYENTGDVSAAKTHRLIEICKQAEAKEYLSGPAAKAYINPDLFADAGITLTYMDYSGYPEYKQLFPPFAHSVSILDLIFNEGINAPKFMKSFSSPNVASYAQPLSP